MLRKQEANRKDTSTYSWVVGHENIGVPCRLNCWKEIRVFGT